jgi:hypothetical protein
MECVDAAVKRQQLFAQLHSKRMMTTLYYMAMTERLRFFNFFISGLSGTDSQITPFPVPHSATCRPGVHAACHKRGAEYKQSGSP